jgi:hypothetical protein
MMKFSFILKMKPLIKTLTLMETSLKTIIYLEKVRLRRTAKIGDRYNYYRLELVAVDRGFN